MTSNATSTSPSPMVKRRKTKEEPVVKKTPQQSPLEASEATASPRSLSSVSLSDDGRLGLLDEATSRPNRPLLISFTDLETSSATSDSLDGLTDGESGSEGEFGTAASCGETLNEADYQQHLALLKVRYKAELEKIEDEIAVAENSYFGTRRTRVGSILKGYGDYATCNMDVIRNKTYCKPVKLGERSFSLSSRTSRIHKDYEEECKNAALSREAQFAAGVGYYPPGMDPTGLDPALNPMAQRMAMDYYPGSCQTDPYGYPMGGPLSGHPSESHPYGQPGGYASYLYTPQNPHLFLNYDARPTIPLQSPQMMGPSMRSGNGSQVCPSALENGDPATTLASGDCVLSSNTPLKRPSGEEELNGGDSNFNVEQFLNVARQSDG